MFKFIRFYLVWGRGYQCILSLETASAGGCQTIVHRKKKSNRIKIQELALKLEISKPVELIERKGILGMAQAQGVDMLSGRIGIAIDPDGIDEISEAELEFLIAHELSHIKTNDAFWMFVVPAIVGVVGTLAISILFPSLAVLFSSTILAWTLFSPVAVIGSIIPLVVFPFFSKWREECADKLGFSVCSEEAQKAASTFFENIRISHLEMRNEPVDSSCLKFLIQTEINEDGESCWDILHPSLAARSSYLQVKANL